MPQSSTVIFTADWVLPVSDAPIAQGAVAIRGEKIVDVGPQADVLGRTAGRVSRLKNTVLCPGLINAHAHLELSDLRDKITWHGEFTDWIRQVIPFIVRHKEEDVVRISKRGAREMIASGITTVGNHDKRGYSIHALKEVGMRGVVFLEMIGFLGKLAKEQMDSVKKVAQRLPADKLRTVGIAMQSPYACSPQLIKLGHDFTRKKKWPFSIHLSELQQEIEFVKTGENEFKTLAQDRGFWDEDWKTPGVSPVKYADRLKVLDEGTLGVHLNYVKPGDVDILKRRKLTAVFCPKSHKYFKHPLHPLERYLKNGVHVALGTDSLASNDSLGMLDEMRLVKKRHPKLDCAVILELATLGGARALGMLDRVGSLEKGKAADMAAYRLPDGFKGQPADYIVKKARKAKFTMVAGQKIYKGR